MPVMSSTYLGESAIPVYLVSTVDVVACGCVLAIYDANNDFSHASALLAMDLMLSFSR